MNNLNIIDDLHSVKVVLTGDTNHNNSVRCLPGFLSKRYLNKYVFDGFELGFKHNEYYISHVSHNFSQTPPLKNEIYSLFSMYGISDTFTYLQGIAQDKATVFKVHNDPLIRKGPELIKSLEQNMQSMVRENFGNTGQQNLHGLIGGMTVQLLSTYK